MRTLSRLAGLLRLEDFALALLTVVGIPVLERWLGSGASSTASDAEPTVLVGILGLMAVVGIIAVVLSRGPDEPPPLEDGRLTLQG